jgi:hypothetical protein
MSVLIDRRTVGVVDVTPDRFRIGEEGGRGCVDARSGRSSVAVGASVVDGGEVVAAVAFRSILLDRVGQDADAFDLDVDDVAGGKEDRTVPECTDPCWCPGGNDVACFLLSGTCASWGLTPATGGGNVYRA